MEGRSHVLSGWCTGALTAGTLGLPPAGIVGFGCVAAGASALNDLDHDDAAASRVLGPLSRLLAEVVQACARGVYRLTRGPGDPPRRGAHRGATHALPLLVVPCGLLWLLPRVLPVAWAAVMVATVIGFCLLLVADRLGSAVLVAAVIAVVAWGAGWPDDLVGALVSVGPWVALAVLIGTVTHVLGDLVTEAGLYAFAPLYRVAVGTERERRWVRVALPKWLAFRTGGATERLVVYPLLVASGCLIALFVLAPSQFEEFVSELPNLFVSHHPSPSPWVSGRSSGIAGW